MGLVGPLVFLCATLGIYVSYLTQGVVLEKLSRDDFGPEQVHFRSMAALPWLQSVVCCFVAYCVSIATSGSEKDFPPVWSYWKPSLSAALGPALGNASLKNISYPAQVVVKSCKMIPVMVVGCVVHGVQYETVQWVITGMICLGLGIFSFKSSAKTTAKLADPNLVLGYTLCFSNLICDGYTTSTQDAINKKYKKNSPIHMMCYMNFWMMVYYTAWFVALEVTGLGSTIKEITDFMSDIEFRTHVLKFCACGAFGQLFIFWMIKAQGSLTNTLVCTTRKFFSILLSVFWNGTPLVVPQWVGVVLVFGGVLWSIYFKQVNKSVKSHMKFKDKDEGRPTNGDVYHNQEPARKRSAKSVQS